MNRLNGWQRLWVVLSVVYLVVVMTFAWITWPSDSSIPADKWTIFELNHASSADYRDVLKRLKSGDPTGPDIVSKFTPHEKEAFLAYQQHPDEVVFSVAALNLMIAEGGLAPEVEKRLSPNDGVLVNAIRSARREARSARRRQQVQRAAIVWIVPTLSLYVFGWSVGWIRQGFRMALSRSKIT